MNDVTSVDLDVQAGVAVITLSGPRVRNALATPSLENFEAVLDELRSSTAVRAVVVTGAGGTFCAGGDLREEAEAAASADPPAAFVQFASHWNEAVLDKLESLSPPTIAAIDGAAVGGGFELAICCDLRIASPGARLGDREVRLGLVGGLARLLRVTPMSTALWLALPSQLLTAAEALRLGLVHEMCSASTALPRALEIANEIARHPPSAVAGAKRLIRYASGLPFDQAMAAELRVIAQLAGDASVSTHLASAKNPSDPGLS